jgi:hypothetical protein
VHLFRIFGVSIALSLTVPAFAQIPDYVSQWQAIPENPSMQTVCSTSLRYASALTALRNRGANLASLLRWAEQESERSAQDSPADPLLPIGTQLMLTKLIQQSYLAVPLYSQIAGGFPQWVYKSCLKGKPVDQ